VAIRLSFQTATVFFRSLLITLANGMVIFPQVEFISFLLKSHSIPKLTLVQDYALFSYCKKSKFLKMNFITVVINF